MCIVVYIKPSRRFCGDITTYINNHPRVHRKIIKGGTCRDHMVEMAWRQWERTLIWHQKLHIWPKRVLASQPSTLGSKFGTCTPGSKSICLRWHGERYSHTMPVSKGSNVADIQLFPLCKRYAGVFYKVDCEDDYLISEKSFKSVHEECNHPQPERQQNAGTIYELSSMLKPFSNPSCISTTMQENLNLTKPQAYVLMYHHSLFHVSYERVREIKRQGYIPRHLATCPARCMHVRKSDHETIVE